ncbi:MAG: Response regulator receiver protein [Parcubacteria group bacterium GW2011_GWA2_43_9b]|uniref:Response regulatory domain-containing protein n=1 Tax=Candidatus Portnoybacteria bacterium RIFCSPLOWO2_02_FULL_39_11 TaxID=1802001 RepID=A0A1G2FRC0_9BACT|nr:MAG: Response regulator receiver protein [Parcubacteria group bacterium GW2011_GWA2_43_9b]OGZ40593.1 MAG: hypothetical protein A3B04_02485 [Candidatus Portnoybacteria bacterium RIFCSPLOWO2_02_FULL_39_11]
MKTILLVEDEPTLQKTLSLALTQEGYEVKSALDGEIGLRLARESKPDIVLLDLILPKMDGFEVLDELKKDEATKNIPVIVLTNLESTQDIEKALALGATNYLVKANYDLKDVIEKVKDNIKM